MIKKYVLNQKNRIQKQTQKFESFSEENQENVRSSLKYSLSFKNISLLRNVTREPIHCIEDNYSKSKVCFFSEYNILYVAFQMTVSIRDMLFDLDMRVTKWPYFINRKRSFVHRGFAHKYFRLRSKYLEFVKEYVTNYPNTQIILTGHSLGGALALLAASDEKSNISSYVKNVFAFGSPEIGHKIWAQNIENLYTSEQIYRLHSLRDLIPKVYNPLFTHVGNEIHLDAIEKSPLVSISHYLFQGIGKYYPSPLFYAELLFGDENMVRQELYLLQQNY